MKAVIRAMAILALAGGIASCGILQPANGGRRISDTDAQIDIIYNHYPELYAYYAEGLMSIQSIVEIPSSDGTIDYELNYRLKKRQIRNDSERLFILKDRFPDIYNGVRKGTMSVKRMYAYVDGNGDIQYHVDCKYPR